MLMLVFYNEENEVVGNFGSFDKHPKIEKIQAIIDDLDGEAVKKAAYCKVEERFYLVNNKNT
ncbi:hypothetical protein [Paenibacillus sp. FSL H3-0286]|uniref:hypothetical protein n=1 Tax=Paenibacillus sp. FSL H3-0286 TaxID=2921427 RepID=UPI00325289FA